MTKSKRVVRIRSGHPKRYKAADGPKPSEAHRATVEGKVNYCPTCGRYYVVLDGDVHFLTLL